MSTKLLVNGRIHSPSNPDATAMAVTDGIIVWLGDDTPARALHPDAEVVDLQGAFVAPAFVDAHVHLTDTGLGMIGLDLAGAGSLADCLAAVRAHAQANPDAPVIWGHGWDDTAWPEARAPRTAELDACAPGRPIYLARVDEHSAVASSVLRPGPAGAAQDGPLTGADHHAVRSRARALLPAEDLAAARRAVLDHAAAHGVVAVHECGGPEIAGLQDFTEVLALEHGVAVRGYWGELVDTPEQARATLAATGAHALGGDLFVDGALGSHTAWVTGGYADSAEAGEGQAFLTVGQIAAHLRACTTAKIQAGFHAIGDGAISAVTEAFRLVAAELGGPAIASCGHRIEHVEMITPEQSAFLGGLAVVASVQPQFDALWGGPAGMYASRLGAERAAAMNPYARMAADGMTLAIGSDAPVTPMQPWDAVRAAIGHQTEGSGVSARGAFTAATRGAWRAGGHRDGLAGTLVAGAPASYAIWETGELVVASASGSVQRWSMDPRSRVPALPDLSDPAVNPVCLETVREGVTIYTRAV